LELPTEKATSIAGSGSATMAPLLKVMVMARVLLVRSPRLGFVGGLHKEVGA
jgi:hypothetical protein